MKCYPITKHANGCKIHSSPLSHYIKFIYIFFGFDLSCIVVYFFCVMPTTVLSQKKAFSKCNNIPDLLSGGFMEDVNSSKYPVKIL